MKNSFFFPIYTGVHMHLMRIACMVFTHITPISLDKTGTSYVISDITEAHTYMVVQIVLKL